MAQLDPLLQALIDRNAEELILVDGKQPVFRFGAELKRVSQKSLNGAQIAALLSELAGSIEAARIADGQPSTFVYDLGGDQRFACDFGGQEQDWQARISPTAQAAGGRGATPETASRSLPVTGTPADAPPPSAPVTSDHSPSPPTSHAAPPKPQPSIDSSTTAGALEIDTYLCRLVEIGGSDLHLSANETPMVRRDGEMARLEGAPALSADDTRRMLEEMMPKSNLEQFHETSDTDFGYEIENVARFRANIFMDRKGPGAVFRIIPTKILTAQDLSLPQATLDLCNLVKGLVLVTGPTGSGKSTTLAAMIDHINRSRKDHIITIEDPIEFVHPNRECLVNQREIHNHTSGFKTALRAALREDPDIVLVGEMRDLETIAIAIETAETGHLVFGTLHTTTACSTVDRIIDQFPADRQAQIRTMLSESLRGVISQTLLKKIGGGRVAALEILLVTPAISNLIREGKTFQIPSLMQTGRRMGMVMLNDSLLNLVKKKVVTPEEAHLKAADKSGLAGAMAKAGFQLKTPTET